MSLARLCSTGVPRRQFTTPYLYRRWVSAGHGEQYGSFSKEGLLCVLEAETFNEM